MAKRMLVDATHPEETRVVVVNGNRLDELDFEIASRKQLKGNIYLAKVIRVEPSLQAAFVEYGGNRHGFLAFSEIHPDYYRIPVADREALMREYERAAREEEEARSRDRYDDGDHADNGDHGDHGDHADHGDTGYHDAADGDHDGDGASESNDTGAVSVGGDIADTDTAVEEPGADTLPAPTTPDEVIAATTGAEGESPFSAEGEAAAAPAPKKRAPRTRKPKAAAAEAAPEASAEAAPEAAADAAAEDGAADGAAEGDAKPKRKRAPRKPKTVAMTADQGESVEEEVEDVRKPRSARPLKSYKIQEVIKRRQILLVQVTKEERGNKGAALTTYLSLPGRYCVLMPNTPRGGGISRKITNPADRKRMKELLEGLDVPDGMSVILRTAGIERSKPEIKRDLEYLMRLWDSIREQTLQSVAPALIYEEANLIKRSIRDLYSEDIDELHVEGDDGYRIAKDFMRMLMPSHVRKVQRYDDDIPLFHRFQVEGQIEAMFNPVVQLKSGGYIVINQTEALVAIDVNSGRSTKERNIEETALKTNLEAADEVARQLRLRDLAGLIVIDFIDMEEGRNNAAVEKRLKEAMKADRARIQLGRISMFGLLELSRQRLRPSLQEINFERCPHCSGTGMVRSMESAALAVLRAIEEEGIKRRSSEITVSAATQIALYILNQKRDALAIMELKYGLRVFMHADDSLIPPEHRLERIRARGPEDDRPVAAISAEKVFAETDRALEAEDDGADEPELDGDEGEETVAEATGERPQANGDRDRDGRRRRRRRRRRNGESRFEVSHESRVLDAAEAQLPSTIADGGEGDEEEDEDGTGDDAGDDADNGTGEARADGNGENGDARRKRRRGKRGGRRRARQREAGQNGEDFAGEEQGGEDFAGDDASGDDAAGEDIGPAAALDDGETAGEADAAEPGAADTAADAAPVTAEPAPAEEAPRKRPARGRRKPADGEEAAPAPVTAEAAPAAAPASEEGPKKRPSRSRRKTAEDTAPAEAALAEAAPTAPVADAAPATEPAAAPAAEVAPDAATPVEEPANHAIVVNPPVEQPKKGWWSRLTKG